MRKCIKVLATIGVVILAFVATPLAVKIVEDESGVQLFKKGQV